MAPKNKHQEEVELRKKKEKELCQLAEFAINFQFTILKMNKDFKTKFTVKIGLSFGNEGIGQNGSVISGVIGQDSPQC